MRIALTSRPPRPGPLAAGLLAGSVLDALLGDPRRGHPVAAFGTAAARLERLIWADSRARGVGYTAICAGLPVVIGLLAQRSSRAPLTTAAIVTSATWTVLGARTLREEGAALNSLLAAGDLAGARQRLTHLAGRDPRGLDAAEIARAAVESIAENTSDAVVGPLFWGAVGGLPGLLGYRAVNTLDAMVGHRSPRYLRFGWAAARLDDLANLAPARLTALLVAVIAPAVGGRARDVVRIALRDAGRHPSPNSGWCEASFAAALGLRLGGTNIYGTRVERRPSLGDGRPATAADLLRAARLNRLVSLAAALIASAAAAGAASVRARR
ncbi:MAG TPA: cobalamin biosynthesis protein [Jatrophihabitantaceae bacterium]|nr:cobalamin biosynthesis protein [Jatrophihabitantaceae bacterium]